MADHQRLEVSAAARVLPCLAAVRGAYRIEIQFQVALESFLDEVDSHNAPGTGGRHTALQYYAVWGVDGVKT